MLSTINGGPYKPTHTKHPCALWAGRSADNYEWLWLHGMAMCEEYTHRYGKTHKCQGIIEHLSNAPAVGNGLTEHVQCMPDEFKRDDVVDAYLAYYCGAKADFESGQKEMFLNGSNNLHKTKN